MTPTIPIGSMYDIYVINIYIYIYLPTFTIDFFAKCMLPVNLPVRKWIRHGIDFYRRFRTEAWSTWLHWRVPLVAPFLPSFKHGSWTCTLGEWVPWGFRKRVENGLDAGFFLTHPRSVVMFKIFFCAQCLQLCWETSWYFERGRVWNLGVNAMFLDSYVSV